MEIIGIHGVARSGKNTVGDYLSLQHGYYPLSFAAPLKELIQKYLFVDCSDTLDRNREVEISVSDTTLFKMALHLVVVAETSEFVERFRGIFAPFSTEVNDAHVRYRVSVRKLMQLLGTDVIRYFDEDYWVYRLVSSMTRLRMQDVYKFVITDVRIDNEAKALQELGGVVLEVYRPGVSDERMDHISEAGLSSVTHTVYNDGSLEHLYSEVDRFVENYKEGR